MTDTRALILERISGALRDVPSGEQPGDIWVPREYRRAGLTAPPGVLSLFAERAAEYRARVVRATGRSAAATVARLLADQDIADLVIPPGFPARYLPPPGAHTPLHDEPRLSAGALDAAHGVITTCALAIAETGTIILDASPGQGRRALTLLPDYHLCLVHAGQVVATVPDAIARLNPRRPLTMISGPSATSDIENNRVEGVHGPRTLHVLIIEPDDEPDQP
jgi:L-lactate dehydrogenase complex protein LldG